VGAFSQADESEQTSSMNVLYFVFAGVVVCICLSGLLLCKIKRERYGGAQYLSASEMSFTSDRAGHTWKIDDDDDFVFWGETEQDNTTKRVPDKRKPGTSRIETVQSASTSKRKPHPTNSTKDLESILVTHKQWTDDNGEVSDVEIWGDANIDDTKRVPDKRRSVTAVPNQDVRRRSSIKRMPAPMKITEYLEGILVDDQGEILLTGEETRLDDFGGTARSDSEHFDNVTSLSNLDNRFATSKKIDHFITEGEVFVMGSAGTHFDGFGGAAKSDSETFDTAPSLSNVDKRFPTHRTSGRFTDIAIKRFPAQEQSI